MRANDDHLIKHATASRGASCPPSWPEVATFILQFELGSPPSFFPLPLLVLTTRQHSTQSVCILHLPAAFYEPRLYVCTVPAIIKFLPFSCGCRGGKLGNLIGFGLMAASRRWRFFTEFFTEFFPDFTHFYFPDFDFDLQFKLGVAQLIEVVFIFN